MVNHRTPWLDTGIRGCTDSNRIQTAPPGVPLTAEMRAQVQQPTLREPSCQPARHTQCQRASRHCASILQRLARPPTRLTQRSCCQRRRPSRWAHARLLPTHLTQMSPTARLLRQETTMPGAASSLGLHTPSRWQATLTTAKLKGQLCTVLAQASIRSQHHQVDQPIACHVLASRRTRTARR
jgi:hypothetical protein